MSQKAHKSKSNCLYLRDCKRRSHLTLCVSERIEGNFDHLCSKRLTKANLFACISNSAEHKVVGLCFRECRRQKWLFVSQKAGTVVSHRFRTLTISITDYIHEFWLLTKPSSDGTSLHRLFCVLPDIRGQ